MVIVDGIVMAVVMLGVAVFEVLLVRVTIVVR